MAYLRDYPNDLLKNQRKIVKALVGRSITNHWEKYLIPYFPVNNLGPKERPMMEEFCATLQSNA
jgi:hypothetical protein